MENTHNTLQSSEPAKPQPNSRLHALPQELQDIIYALVVVSPTPIPARIHLRDVATKTSDLTNPFTTLAKVEPTQPALSRLDRETRPAVLRIFYEQNTFLFRTHTYDQQPLHTWFEATQHDYTPTVRLIRRVMLEMSVRKTCGVPPQPLPQFLPRPMGKVREEQHLYHVLVAARPGEEGLRVRFKADLAVMCSCAMRAAGLLRPAKLLELSEVMDQSSDSSSAALSLARDIEAEICLMENCK